MCTVHMPYRGAEIAALLRHSRRSSPFARPAGERNVRRHRRTAVGNRNDGDAGEGFSGAGGGGPFLLLYTSGTTASPKGVPHNYHTMLSNARLGVPEHGSRRPTASFRGAVHASLRPVRAALRVSLRAASVCCPHSHRLIECSDRKQKTDGVVDAPPTSPRCARRAVRQARLVVAQARDHVGSACRRSSCGNFPSG
jgi:acyl-CoA synthetase (AMP-forming)/AMP-acid ligase II